MRYPLTALRVCVVLLASGCHSAKSPNTSNFTKAINQYLDKNGGECISPLRPLPIDIPVADLAQTSAIMAQLSALEKSGLVAGKTMTVVPQTPLNPFSISRPAPQPVKRYDATPEGNRYLRSYFTSIGRAEGFCYGVRQVASIVKWDEPVTQGGYAITSVTYTHKIDRLADWAKSPEMQQAFPLLKSSFGLVGTEQRATLHPTNQGWEVDGF